MPTDIEHDAPRIVMFTEEMAKEAREDRVDLLEEARLLAESRSTIYQQKLRNYHSRCARHVRFQEGDLVLRLIQDTKGMHKLSSPWEGPFIVSKALINDAYYLIDAREHKEDTMDKEGDETERPWNAALLRRFYT